MNQKLVIGFILIQLVGLCGFAQGKKSISKNKIKSVTENLTLYENGKEITYKECFTLYSKSGEVLEETTYNKDGTILKQEKFQYATGRKQTEHTIYHQMDENHKKGIENKRFTFKYNINNDKTEEVEYEGNKMLKKVVYGYNNLGEKSSEMHYDGDNKLSKKIEYAYDGKSLRTKRTSYLSDNTLESVKKYTYEFY